MAENNEDAPRFDDVATFAWVRRPSPERLGLRVVYRGAQLNVDWPKGADANLDRLVAYLPKILTTARKEREVIEFVRDMDFELRQLLGGDE